MKQLKARQEGAQSEQYAVLQCRHYTIPSKDAGGGGKKSAEQILLCSQDLLRALN